MTQNYGPFASGAGSSFSETQWREFFGALVYPGVFKGASVNGVLAGDLVVAASGSTMAVTVQTGVAWVNGFYYENDALLTQAIAASDPSLNRIDFVTVRLDFVGRTVQVNVVQGTLASSPVAPTLSATATLWDVPLATVAVNHGVTSIVTANVTDQRQYAFINPPPFHQGSGSGLNADTVDGINSTAFVLGASASQHIVVVNRTPTNSDGVDGDLIFQW